jgi:hypothetical protein
MFLIDHRNAGQQLIEAHHRLSPYDDAPSPGCLPRRTPYGYTPGATLATAIIPIIPRSKWRSMIENPDQPFLHDLTNNVLPPHDQGKTNYCWAHGSIRALETLRVYEGQQPLILSAESVAVPLTRGRNRGGSPDEALRQIRDYGACRQELWPHNNRDQESAKPGWETDALQYRILDWMDVNGWDAQVTLALHRIPVAIGLGWWGHLVCQLDPVILPDGSIGIGIDNSWGADWGENGYGVLDEKHGTADLGAFAPLSASFAASKS